MNLLALFLLAIGCVSAFSPNSGKSSKPAVRPLFSSFPQSSSKEYDMILSNDEWLRQVLGEENNDQRQVRRTSDGFLTAAGALFTAMMLMMASGVGPVEQPSDTMMESQTERMAQESNQFAEGEVIEMLDQSAGYFFF